MKKLFVLFTVFTIFLVAYCPKANAQVEKITVNTSDLTSDQLAKIKAQQELETMQQKLDTYGKWVGVGGEVGIAVKEGLNAVVDVSDKFGKTDVGKFTLVMIGWKVIGKDIVRIFLGLIFILIYTIFAFRSYKNFITRKVALKTNGWRFWLPKEYTLVKPDDFDGIHFVKVFYLFLFAGAIGLTYAIMFG